MRKIAIIISILVNVYLTAQNNQLLFKSGDRVCFVGNSITSAGEFHHNILLYYITRFPNEQIRFYNCGVSGDNTGGVLNRMNSDILVNNPTHAVIMIGMNDVNRSLYGHKAITNLDTLRLRESAISIYKINLEKIINEFLLKNIKVVLEKPSIYDQTAILPTNNALGVNDALKVCADFMETLATKYNLPIVDYWTIMTKLNSDIQTINPSATLTSKDRVHPESTGHFVMSYQFLKSQGVPKYISKITIESNIKKTNKKAYNCQITNIRRQRKNISFIVKEGSLPYPTVSTQIKGLELVPFVREFNDESLQISNISKGSYRLVIDSVEVGVFDDLHLKAGINLADYSQTPQFQQALNVRNILSELWRIESNLRSLKFIENNKYFDAAPDKENIDSLKIYLNQCFEKNYPNYISFYKQQLNKYIDNVGRRKEFQKQSDSLIEKAYKAAQPVPHTFELIYLN